MRSIVSIIAATSALCGPAHAAFNICNQYRQPIFVALAVYGNDGWADAGWQEIASGSCVDGLGTVVSTQYYIRAETNWFSVGGKKRQKVEWGNDGAKKFYVTAKSFAFSNADRSRKGAQLAGFFESASSSMQQQPRGTITFMPDGVTVSQNVPAPAASPAMSAIPPKAEVAH
jgi:uncharacterized membrane protein